MGPQPTALSVELRELVRLILAFWKAGRLVKWESGKVANIGGVGGVYGGGKLDSGLGFRVALQIGGDNFPTWLSGDRPVFVYHAQLPVCGL